jgi:hypothetical protein
MQTGKYRGNTLWGYAILQQDSIAQPERFEAAQLKDSKVVEASCVLGRFDTDAEAELTGLASCRAWVDNHG